MVAKFLQFKPTSFAHYKYVRTGGLKIFLTDFYILKLIELIYDSCDVMKSLALQL